MKKKIITLLSLVLVISMSFCGCGKNDTKITESEKTEATGTKCTVVDNEGTTVETTFEELLNIKDNNEMRFDKQYAGAQISVIGTVESISAKYFKENDFWNLCYDRILFKEGFSVEIVHGTYDDLLLQLNEGDKVEVQSNISSTQGYTMNGVSISFELKGCHWDNDRDSVSTSKDDWYKTKLKLVE